MCTRLREETHFNYHDNSTAHLHSSETLVSSVTETYCFLRSAQTGFARIVSLAPAGRSFMMGWLGRSSLEDPFADALCEESPHCFSKLGADSGPIGVVGIVLRAVGYASSTELRQRETAM